MAKGDPKYIPLDEILERPTTRLLRALRWFEWVSSIDLLHALGVEWSPERSADNAEHHRYTASLSRLTKTGMVERQGSRSHGYLYRISQKGRDELHRLLQGVISHKSRPRICSACGEAGHYATTCRERRAA